LEKLFAEAGQIPASMFEEEDQRMDRQKLLSRVQLYVIADRKICGKKDIQQVVAEAIDGGAQMIQFRDKESDDHDFLKLARTLRNLCLNVNVPFIINDRVMIAKEIDADGVHVGEEDLSVKEARNILDSDKIIGKTARNFEQAKAAEDEGADYIGLGPVFYTDSKEIGMLIDVEVVGKVTTDLKIPVFAIGGINLNNLDQLLEAGGRRIAVISAVFLSQDIKSSTKALLQKLKSRSQT
jgi:thiamine-phosphate diphosphorylase